jgi:AcrR family transcriptional regulator
VRCASCTERDVDAAFASDVLQHFIVNFDRASTKTKHRRIQMISKRAATKTKSPLPAEQRLVEAALALILKNGSCRGVNLRQIAVRAGCTHTNAYNYFSSLEELFWAALFRALELQIADTAQKLQAGADSQDLLRTFLTAQVLFAQENPGIYRLFWLEPLSGQPPPRVLLRLDEVRQQWVRFIGERLGALRSTANPAWAGEIVHGYFHGEVCKLVGRHAFVPKSKENCTRVVENTITLIDLVSTSGKR